MNIDRSVIAYKRGIEKQKEIELERKRLEARLEMFESFIHTNECSDEGGWFAFFTPNGEIGMCDYMKDGIYVNGCASEREAVQALIKLACAVLEQHVLPEKEPDTVINVGF